MANGVARGPDGAIYASNDVGPGIDRVLDGRSTLDLGDGRLGQRARGRHAPAVALRGADLRPGGDRAGRARRSDRGRDLVRGAGGRLAAGLDGLTRDAHDRLYVAANLGGEVWRVGAAPAACSPTCRRSARARSPSAGASGPGGRPQGSAAATST